MATSRQTSVAPALTRMLSSSAGPKPTAFHMSTKFSSRTWLGSQDGGVRRISLRGLIAVETMTANGKRMTTISGESSSQ